MWAPISIIIYPNTQAIIIPCVWASYSTVTAADIGFPLISIIIASILQIAIIITTVFIIRITDCDALTYFHKEKDFEGIIMHVCISIIGTTIVYKSL